VKIVTEELAREMPMSALIASLALVIAKATRGGEFAFASADTMAEYAMQQEGARILAAEIDRRMPRVP